MNSFTPFHAWGRDKNSKTCPICKYGWYHGVLYHVGNKPNWNNIKIWLEFFENESIRRDQYLKVYFVYGNEDDFIHEKSEMKLHKIGEQLNLKNVALTFVPSFSDKVSSIYLNKINPNIENTIIVYKRSKVIGKFVNLSPNPKNFEKLSNKLDRSINEYFYLPNPKKD